MRRAITPLLFKPYTNLIAPMSTSTAPVQGQITTKLQNAFKPVHLEVINESYKHKVPKGSETHFKVVVVSEAFQDKSLLDRHSIFSYLSRLFFLLCVNVAMCL